MPLKNRGWRGAKQGGGAGREAQQAQTATAARRARGGGGGGCAHLHACHARRGHHAVPVRHGRIIHPRGQLARVCMRRLELKVRLDIVNRLVGCSGLRICQSRSHAGSCGRHVGPYAPCRPMRSPCRPMQAHAGPMQAPCCAFHAHASSMRFPAGAMWRPASAMRCHASSMQLASTLHALLAQ